MLLVFFLLLLLIGWYLLTIVAAIIVIVIIVFWNAGDSSLRFPVASIINTIGTGTRMKRSR